ncbi:GNAT family N-acetyltransferase [Paenibacillus pasadenensis]|uniref:GNAT family N-acetyltransferase n=1 Tax=Paenibacillus pasadenensis TaxID=217090 RepID=UPI003342CBC5
MLQSVVVTTQEQLEQCLAIRREVFVGEQGVSPEEEWDHYDESPQSCIHLLLLDEGIPVGTGRLKPFEDGSAKLQRIAVLASCRGKGTGSILVRAMEEAAREAGFQGAVLDAQCQAEPFYTKLGYTAMSPEIFLDAGIPHIRMSRSWA